MWTMMTTPLGVQHRVSMGLLSVLSVGLACDLTGKAILHSTADLFSSFFAPVMLP